MSHPRHDLDPIVHTPARFSVLALLAAVERAEFRFVRETVELSDSALSQHLTTLERAGYVTVRKTQSGRRTTTWIALTDEGRAAFTRHVALLNQIAGTAP
ncbi:transcriptional regulator [Actinomadura keratinilytica]|jgi:DNA-binding MarR family transcriptional regulator|uniref:Transcriptional regulator n=1 Tax=Actinomadura keratinilytica TaxID=547461 RepID=A0ABP7YAM8_9ACTN